MRRVLLLSMFLVCFAVSATAQSQKSVLKPPAAAAAAPASPAAVNAARASFAKLPLSFEENAGQTDARVKYTSRGSGYNLFLTADEAVFALRAGNASPNCLGPAGKLHPGCADSQKNPREESVLWLKMLGANSAAQIAGTDPLPGKINYYIGNDSSKWRTGVRQFGRVRYKEIYPGVDLTYYGNQQQLESDFIVAPGADPRSIEFEIKGAREDRLDAQGNLVLATSAGNVKLLRPGIYQVINGTRREVSGRYLLQAGNRVGFSVGAYNHHEKLIIDPTLVYSTYLGGSALSSGDMAQAIAIDSTGHAYVTGQGTSADFPGSDMAGPPVESLFGFVFVTEFDPTGSSTPATLVYSTILTGSRENFDTSGNGIGVDGAGNTYVAGVTEATDFPLVNPFQATYGAASRTGFVAGLNSNGNLIYSTYLGGRNYSDSSELLGLFADTAGNAYVVGDSSSPNFPTVNPLQATLNGSQNVVVAKFNNQGQPVYSSYLGGTGTDYGTAIAADGGGNAYLTGYTSSPDFPVQTSPPPFQSTHTGFYGVFVSKLSFGGSGLTLKSSTLLAGSGNDQAMGIAVDTASTPNVYVTGQTTSTDFPIQNPISGTFTSGPYSGGTFGGTVSGEPDAFVTKLNGTFTAPLVYSTYLGGTASDIGFAIGLDASDNAYVTGSTASANFPTQMPLQSALGSSTATNVFLAELNSAGNTLTYSTYLGGTSIDTANGIAVDSTGNAYITGKTTSANFPLVSGGAPGTNPYQGELGGSAGNAFVAKISNTAAAAALNFFPPTYNFHDVGVGASATEVITLSNNTAASTSVSGFAFGGTNSGDFTLTAATAPCVTSAAFTLQAGKTCSLTVQFNPMDQDARSATLTVTYNSTSSSTMNLTGSGGAPEVSLSSTTLSFGSDPLNVQDGFGVTITNTGGGPLSIGSLQISATTPSNAAPFSVPANQNFCPNGPIAPGVSCGITVDFVPTAAGTFNATLLINSNAAGSPATVSLSGTGVQEVLVQPTTLEMGTQLVNSTSMIVTNEAFLENGSGETINITVTPGTGADQGDFHISNNFTNSCATIGPLSPGGNCSLPLYFQPQAASATDGRTGTYTIAWTGGTTVAGVVPSSQIVNVMGTGATGIFLSTASLNASSDYVGYTRGVGPENLYNGTGNPITVSIALSGNNPGDYTVQLVPTCAPGGVIPANTYCDVEITFKPSALGLRTATATFTYTGVSNGQLTLSLSGTGIPGPVEITDTADNFFTQLASADFGTEIMGTTTPVKTFELRNLSTAQLTIQSFTTPANADFKVVSNSCGAGTIPGGGICTIGITFTPSTTAKETSSFTVTDSYASTSGVDMSSPHVVNLFGTGEQPAITISVSTGGTTVLDFGSIQLNPSPAPQAAIYLTNGGNAPTTIPPGGAPVLMTGGSAAFTLVTTGNDATTCTQGAKILPQGGTCVVGVQFVPTATLSGAQTSSVTFSDSVGGSHTVQIKGNGVTQGLMSLSATPPATTSGSVSFTQVAGTTSSVKPVTVYNLGSGPMTITSVSLTSFNGSASNFTIASGTNCTVGAVIASGTSGNSCVFNLTFTAPATAGFYDADLSVQSSLGNNATGSVFVSLSGDSLAGGLALSPAGPINFGAVAVGSTVNSTFYSLTNNNAVPVTFGTMQVPAGYSIPPGFDGCSGTTVTPANSCSFEIAFTPTSSAADNGNLTLPFTGTGLTGSPFTVAIQGSGSIAVVANPNPLNFQFVSVGNISLLGVNITNGSTSPATISGTGAVTGSSAFSIPSGDNFCPNGTVLSAAGASTPGGSCFIDVQFLSSSAGTFNGQFIISYTLGGPTQTVTVLLTATISAAQAVVVSPAPPNPLVFGNQTVNTQSQVMNVVLSNSASAAQSLSVNSFQISGNDFAVGPSASGFCQFAFLSPGQTCTIPVIFTPSQAGTRTGTLTITDNSSPTTQTVNLMGTGIAGTVTASPNPLPFPTTNVGSSVTLGAVFSNTTGSAVKFNSVGFTGPYSIDTGSNTCVNGSMVSAVTGSCVVYIKFTPSGASNAGTATISYGTSGGTVVIPLSGTGSNPIVSVSPTSLTFAGLQLVGTQSAPMPVTLTNGTTSSITISSTPSVSGDYLLGNNSCTSGATITSGSSCSVNVIFKPTATGTRTGTLSIVDATDANSPHNVSLSGTATTPGTITATSGTPQSVVVNTAFSNLTATVKDSNNTVLPGVSVTFTITAAAGGASGTFTGNLTSATVTTDSNGVATCPTLTANNIPGGPFAVAATVGAVGPANFSLTNLPGTPVSITATTGTPQSVSINTAFALLQVTVKDGSSLPLDGISVTFTAPSTGASGTFAGGGTTATATTNTSGVATAPVFAANGTAGGPYTVTAKAGAVGPANFSLTNLAGAPASVTATAGTPQSAIIGAAFATNLAAIVKDGSGNLLSGVVVTFTSPSSGASGTFAGGTSGGTTVTATTGVNGVATASVFTANTTVGAYTVNSSVTGVSTKAAFSLNNTAGPPANIVATSGTPQSAAVTAAFTTNFAATVTDSGGNPISGATVTFTAPASGASGIFTGGTNGGTTVTATTGATGVATAAVFTANSTIGSYTVTAGVTGVVAKASFSLTNTAGPPANIAATAGTPQNATVGNAFATNLQATVTDGGGNPVNNATVTFTAPSSGASGTFAGGTNGGTTITATTNASGVAIAAAFTANTTAGSYTVTASVTGVTAKASYALTNIAGAPASITATAGTPQSATIGTAFATNLAATVKDASGNLVSGATVTFVSPSSGASGTFAGGTSGGTTVTATTNSTGVATATTFTANTVSGLYAVDASVTGVVTKAAFSLTNNAGAPASIAATGGTPQSTTISTVFTTSLAATVKDASGNLVSGATVTFTAPATGASGKFTGGTNGGLTANATTNASGVATAPVFTANTTAGTYTVNATSTGVATAAAFSLTNSVGTAAAITATGGASQSVAINTAFASLQATVADSGGNGVSGVSVTFTVTAAANGASGTFTGGSTTATVTTNASGVATAPTFTANSTASVPGTPYTVAAKAGTIGPANFSLTNLSAPPASITATAGTPQSVAISTAFPTNLQATVFDSGSHPIAGATVTFTAPSSGASGTFAGGTNGGFTVTAVTNSSGVATAPVLTANGVAGGPYNVTATAGAVSVNFVLTNLTGPAASVTATGGATQSVVISTAFAALQATVKDSGGNLLNNVTVTFTAPSSGAGGTFAGGGTTTTATTNASGVATATTFTANTVAGAYTVNASVTGVTAKAAYSLTNLPGAASKIVISGGGSQSVAVNTAFAPLAVTVTDGSGNGVSNVSVTFTAPSSGASGTFTGGTNGGTTAVVTTNASGVAMAPTFTSNNTVGGPYLVAASATGLTTADFSLTNLAGTPASITASSGSNQSVAINAAFTSLVATVKDSHSSPLSGVVVTFTAPSSGASGTFAGGTNGGLTVTATTDANGNATAPTFTANVTAGGPYTVTAVAGTLAPANFSLTNLAGAPASLTASAGTPQSAVISTAFTTNLAVTVKDSGSNLLSGAIVTFTSPSSGASGTFAGGTNGGHTITVTTGANGVATAPVFTADATVGSYTVSASVGALMPASFSLNNTAGPPSSITATAGTPQTVKISTAFPTALAATVKDSGGNPVSGATVTFTAPSSGASGTFAGGTSGGTVVTATTNASGVATAAAFTANGTAGGYTVNASVSGITAPAAFSLTNLAGPPASIAATAGTPQSAPVTTAFTTALQATVKDSGGNLVSGASVTFTAPASGASGTFSGGTNGGTTVIVITNASGVATAPTFTANAIGGTYNVNASVPGVSTNAVFALTNTVAPDVTISKSHTSDFVVGANGTYSIKLTNNGTGPTTGTVTVTDILPAGLTFVSGTSTGGWTCVANGQAVTCTNATIGLLAAKGGTATITITVSVGPSAITSTSAGGFQVTNSATVADPGDSGTNDKSATDVPTNLDNAVPTQSSFSPSTGLIVGAGVTAPQQITLTGTGFNSTTQVTIGSNGPFTGTANAAGTSLTINVPASDLSATSAAGNATISASNPKNPTSNAGGGSAPTTQTFPLVAVNATQDSATAGTIMVIAGTPAMVKIDYATNPVAAPLPAALTISCAVPMSLTGATCSVGTPTIAAGATSGSSIITINAVPTSSGSSATGPRFGGRGPWSNYLLWSVVAALLSMLALTRKFQQRAPQLRRAPVYLALVLLVVGAGVMAGCTTAAKPTPTPTGASTITVTATAADGATVTTTVMIIVSN